MAEKYITYKIDGKIFDVPESHSADVERKYPNATIEMHMDGKIFDIPISHKSDALNKYGSNISYTFDGGDKTENNTIQSPIQTNDVNTAIDNDVKQKTSWGESLAKGAGAGFTRSGKGILDALQLLSSGMLYNDPETGEAKRLDDYDTQMQDKANAFRNASIMAGETAERLSREADPTGGEKGFVDLISEGKIGTALQKGLSTGAESLPMTLSAYNPYTMALNMISMAGANYAEQTLENPEVDKWKRATQAIGSAALEQAVEKFADPVFKYIGGGKTIGNITEEAAKEMLEKGTKGAIDSIWKRIVKVIKNVGKDAAGEGTEEIITSFGNDALGEALDIIDGNKDYGIRAQWEQMKEQNPDADITDFAKSKAKEYMDAFIGGALSGAYMSSPTQIISETGQYLQDNNALNELNKSREAGSKLDMRFMYDVDNSVRESSAAVIEEYSNENGESSISVEFIDGLTSQDAFKLSQNEDLTSGQRGALFNLARAKAFQEGLNQRLDAELDARINAQNTLIDSVAENGTIVTGLYNNKRVYVKGGIAQNDGTIKLPNANGNGPVIIIDAITGEQITVRSEDISNAISQKADEFKTGIAEAIRLADQSNRDTARNTMSAIAKLKAVKPYEGKKILVDVGNGVTEVYVQQITNNGDVIIKGKKGDLGGQSILTIKADTFYDSIYRNEDGSPVLTEAGQDAYNQGSEAKDAQVTSEAEDYRDGTYTILDGDVVRSVEVTSQDDASNTIVYQYTDENGVQKIKTTDLAGFKDAIKKAEGKENSSQTIDIEQPAATTSVEAEPTGITEPPIENEPVTPEETDWDALFEQDKDAYLVEMQKQFGDETIEILNDIIAATQQDLDSLNNEKPKNQNEIIANRAQKKQLQKKIETLNGMVANLTRMQNTAGELPDSPTEPKVEGFVFENGKVKNPLVLQLPNSEGTTSRILLAEKDGKWGFSAYAVLDDGNESGTPDIQEGNLKYDTKEDAITAAISYFNFYKDLKKNSPSTGLDSFVQYINDTYLSDSTAPTHPVPDVNVPDFSSDKASEARSRGYRITSGQRIDRHNATTGIYGNDIEIAFTADSKGKRSGKVKIIDAGSLVPSHIGGVENVEHFLPEAQPKKRTDRASTVSASLIAQNMNNPQMTTVTTSAYEGAPIVNKRGEVIQGNNRSAALLEMYQSHASKAAEYKQYLIDHAEEFGLNANEVAAMQSPVLVRELDVDDADAINLGQYTMQDMESGGNQSIDSGRAIAGLNNKDMMNYFIQTLLAEENDESSDMNISDLITRNGNAAIKLLYSQGIINQTQYQTAIGPDGRITADARASLRGIIEQQLFAGGIDNLSIMFETLPDRAKKAIMQTIARDIKNKDGEKVTPYIQQAIEIYYHLNQQSDFVSAKSDAEIKAAIDGYKRQTSFDESRTPEEKYSNFAFELAFLFKARTQKEIRSMFNALYEEMSGEANLFAEASEGKTLAEAVLEVYGITLNIINDETYGQGGTHVLDTGNGEGTEGRQGSDGNLAEGAVFGQGGQRAANGGADSSILGGSSEQGAGEVKPVAPTPVTNPVDEARKKERQLDLNLKKVGISPEAKQDLAFNTGKAVADMFATREEYDTYAESATDFGVYNADFERGVEESFANRQQNTGVSQGNSVPLEAEPNGENNDEQGETDGPSGIRQGVSDNSERTSDERGKAGNKRAPKESEGKNNKGKAGEQIAEKYPARRGNATQKLLIDTFGFDIIEIPNSRKETLNTIYDFMMAMSKMLGISPKSIGQGGWLNVGSLRSNASSSAEHSLLYNRFDQSVSKPTLKYKYSKLKGLAHEWWHALDHALSYFETGKGRITASEISSRSFTGRRETWDAVHQVIEAIKDSGHVSRIYSLKFPPRYTSYYLEPSEMAARAFEEYIKAKFASAGIVIENAVDTDFVAQPTAEEMAVITPAFDNLFKVLQEKEGKKPGTSILFQIGEDTNERLEGISEKATRLADEAVALMINEGGIETVSVSNKEAEQMHEASGANVDFMIAPDKPIFVSNAAMAVAAIKMEKATPEQWLKMIEKAGGLKAGEDKWMELSEWLKASDKKTLTKQDVLDYIHENTIQIEEVNYIPEINFTAEEQKHVAAMNKEFAALRQSAREAGESYADAGEIAYQQMADKYGDDFTLGFGVDMGELYVSNIEAAASITGIELRQEREINSTRLDYTTGGLDNKKEIAIVVPTVESWNKYDEVHFGDAGDGRAVAWIRFGETKKLLGTTEVEGKKKFNWAKVLVIDEIQSKRHQEGRDRGYSIRGEEYQKRLDSLETEAGDRLKRRTELLRTLTEKYGEDFRSYLKLENTAYVPNESVMSPEEVQEWDATSQEEINDAIDVLKKQKRAGVPDAPFDKNWHELAMKRMLRYAAENGYDVVAWTKGDQQADRYSLTKSFSSIEREDRPDGDGGRRFSLYGGNVETIYVDENGVVTSSSISNELEDKPLSDVVGKELAVKMMSLENYDTIDGEDLRIGGEGMKGFYDKILPAFMNKYGKKWGVKVEDIHLSLEGGLDMHSVPVTEEMKASVIEGQPMFMKRPNGKVYGWTDGKKIYLTKDGFNPNTRVHEYTHLWAKAMMQKNPKGWQSIKDLLRGTPIWNEVINDANYSSIHHDEDMVASEALSRISGTKNAAKLERMAQQMIDEAKGTMRKLEAQGLIQRIKDALNEFWSWVGTNLFGIEKFDSVEQVTDRVLWDLMNKTDLGELSEGQVETQIVTDPKVVEELEDSPKRAGYRNVVQNEDGTFSSPMAYWLQSTKGGAKTRVETAKFELGKWEEAEEHPELVDEKGHVTLVKPNKSTVEVAYDPYIHNRLDPVNLQFKDAWKREELVYVETEVPETDLESGYHADGALLPVGVHSWSNGDLMLSKYDKPVRIMPWEDVADAWVERLNGEGVHFDVVPPALRTLLVERSVEILPPHKGMGKDCNDAYNEWKKENPQSVPQDSSTSPSPKVESNQMAERTQTKDAAKIQKSIESLRELASLSKNAKVVNASTIVNHLADALHIIVKRNETSDTSKRNKYVLPNGETLSVRLSKHNTSASTYIEFNFNQKYNLAVTIKSIRKPNTFVADEGVRLDEYVYFIEDIKKYNGSVLSEIASSLADFLEFGVYVDTTGIAKINTSPKGVAPRTLENYNQDSEIEITKKNFILDPDSISQETAKQTYDRVVNDGWQEFQRQFQDAYQPVRIAIDAIQQETGNLPIEDYENYLLMQNQSSSRSRVETDNFRRKYYDPIYNQIEKIVNKILESRGYDIHDKAKRAEAYAEIKRYLIAKHGLERNMYYQSTKTRKLNPSEKKIAQKETQNVYNAEVSIINSDTSLTDTERELKLREAQDAFTAALTEIETREVPDLRDYSGLTSLFGMDPKEFEKAEEEAQRVVDEFESEVGTITDELWNKINKATGYTLRHSYESGLLSRSQYEQVKSMFEFYIPLRGFDETTAEDVYSYARFEGNRFNAVDQTAKGRTSVADDPIATIMNMAESEISQGNKNRAKQALYYYLLNRSKGGQNQNSLMQLEDVWYIETVDESGNTISQIAAPDHENGETYEEFEDRMTALAAEGKAAKSKKGKVDIGMRFQKQKHLNAHYVYLKVNGIEKAIYINGDPKAADAINGTHTQKNQFGESTMRSINRVLSSTFTNYSLEFTARNYFRDMFYSHINIDVREPDPAYRKKFRQNWRHNNIGTMIKMLKSYRAGEFDGRPLTEDEAAFVEFMNNGGQTGYTLINSVENHKKDLQNAIERMQNGLEKGGIKDSTAFKFTLGAIELLNEASELVTRFAAFKTSRDMGRGVVRSISDAKEITVNFNTKGAQDGNGWMGAIARYLGWSKFFFNASVQGVQNIAAMARANKLKFGSVVGSVFATGLLMPAITAAISSIFGGDDDDNEYWNIPEYERQNNFCIVIGNGKYIKIPLPIGFREIYALGDMTASMMWDKKFTRDTMQVGMDMANKIASVILPINPLESSANGLSIWHSIGYTLAPSSAQFLIQNMSNVDWKGAPLQKEYTYNENDPQWMKAFASNPTWMRSLSKWFNENTRFGDYEGWDWSPEKLDNTLSNMFGGIYSLIKKTGRSVSMIWNEENRNLSNIPLSGVVLGSGIENDDRFVTDAYFDMNDYYNANVNFIKRRAEKFGYNLEDVFVKRKGIHHPKMLEIYSNPTFEWMQMWYNGNEELKELKNKINKLEAQLESKESPSEQQLYSLAKLKAKFTEERRDFVDDMLELD